MTINGQVGKCNKLVWRKFVHHVILTTPTRTTPAPCPVSGPVYLLLNQHVKSSSRMSVSATEWWKHRTITCWFDSVPTARWCGVKWKSLYLSPKPMIPSEMMDAWTERGLVDVYVLTSSGSRSHWPTSPTTGAGLPPAASQDGHRWGR